MRATPRIQFEVAHGGTTHKACFQSLLRDSSVWNLLRQPGMIRSGGREKLLIGTATAAPD